MTAGLKHLFVQATLKASFSPRLKMMMWKSKNRDFIQECVAEEGG